MLSDGCTWYDALAVTQVRDALQILDDIKFQTIDEKQITK